MSYPWVFQQIEGRDERKKLELKGWNAPFGRPRKDPIFNEVIKSRAQTTYYPGVTGQKPTRHTFGTNHEPMELKGRWMSPQLYQYGGLDANMQADLWKKFVQDQRQCRMSWGQILSYEVFIEELHLARESEHQIAWKMKIAIDKADDAKPSASVAPSPTRDLQAFQTDLDAFQMTRVPPKKLSDAMAPDFLETLDNIAGALNGPSAALNRIAGQVADFERASFSTLQHFRSAVSGLESAVITFQNALMSATIDGAILVRSAESDLAWVKFQLDMDDQITGILGVLSQADRSAALAARSAPSKIITAKLFDTWESLSTRSTGGPDKAEDIRAANGARYGERPIAGETYVVF